MPVSRKRKGAKKHKQNQKYVYEHEPNIPKTLVDMKNTINRMIIAG